VLLKKKKLKKQQMTTESSVFLHIKWISAIFVFNTTRILLISKSKSLATSYRPLKDL